MNILARHILYNSILFYKNTSAMELLQNYMNLVKYKLYSINLLVSLFNTALMTCDILNHINETFVVLHAQKIEPIHARTHLRIFQRSISLI